MILAAPNEPPAILRGLRDSSRTMHAHPWIEEAWGVDYLLADPTFGTAGVQRKAFPDDLASSLDDGRLALFLRKSKVLDHRLLVLEGSMPWWSERTGIDPVRFRGTLFSLEQYHRVGICWTLDSADTVEAILQWFGWLSHPHGSLEHRPWTNLKNDSWSDPFSRARRGWFLEGLPQIGPVLALAMLDACGGCLPVSWTGPDPTSIPGIGPKRAALIRQFFETKEQT